MGPISKSGSKVITMKKFISIFLLTILSLVVLLSIGCEKQMVKNEIIQFDEEYWEINEDWKNTFEKMNNDIEILNRSDTEPIDRIEGTIELLEELKENHNNRLKIFKKLHIPEPLDGFYYKKLEQLEKYEMGLIKEIESKNKLKVLALLIPVGEDKNLPSKETIENYMADIEELNNESIKYYDEDKELERECDMMQREVYRENGLDDLIYRWQ